jgi:DNA-binding NarL/FixJ family response regulator
MTTVVVEDQTFLREILAEVCRRDLHHEQVIAAADGLKGLEAILANRPETVLLDLELPNLDGFEIIRMARAAGLKPRFLIFSSHLDEYTVYRVEKALVPGFLDKELQGLKPLQQAIQTVSEGGTCFSEQFLRMKNRRHADPNRFDLVLTQREIEILTMVGDLMTDYEIGSELEVADETIARHRYNIRKKLGTGGKLLDDLLKYAQNNGFRRSIARKAIL